MIRKWGRDLNWQWCGAKTLAQSVGAGWGFCNLCKEDLELLLWHRVLKDKRPVVHMLGEDTHP